MRGGLERTIKVTQNTLNNDFRKGNDRVRKKLPNLEA
jgi:hypothetical protein